MYFLRRNRRNAVIPGEVAGVEREDVRDAVSEHQRGKASIVGLLATNAVFNGQLEPLTRDVGRLGKNGESVRDSQKASRSVRGSHTKAVDLTRSRKRYPVLNENLGARADVVPGAQEPADCRRAQVMRRILCKAPTDQNTGVCEVDQRPRGGSYRLSRSSASFGMLKPRTASSSNRSRASRRRLISSSDSCGPGGRSSASSGPTGMSTGSSGTMTLPSKWTRMTMDMMTRLYHVPALPHAGRQEVAASAPAGAGAQKKGKQRMRSLMAALAALTLLTTAACADAVPQLVNYQGKVYQPSGAAVPDGAYKIAFSIYDVPTGGTAIWTETYDALQVKGSAFHVLLGSVNPIGASIFGSAERFLGVKLANDPELAPRQKIASVPYAMVAETVADGSVTTAKLAAGAITADKIAPSAGVPVGTLLPFAGTAVPQGWLSCDGSAISRSAYPELLAAIGASWGSGDGTSTFNLPDLRGRFLRGQDAGAGIDPDRAGRLASKPGGNTGDAIGSVQSDAFQGHYHRTIGSQSPQAWTGMTGIVDIQNEQDAWSNAREPTSDGSHGNPRIASETRPVNAYVNFIISAGH